MFLSRRLCRFSLSIRSLSAICSLANSFSICRNWCTQTAGKLNLTSSPQGEVTYYSCNKWTPHASLELNETDTLCNAHLVHFPHTTELCTDILELLDLQTLRLWEGLQLTELLLTLSQSPTQLAHPLLRLTQWCLQAGQGQKEKTQQYSVIYCNIYVKL